MNLYAERRGKGENKEFPSYHLACVRQEMID